MKNKLSSRQKKALHTRKSLAESAVKLFKEKGYENVNVEDITQLARTSKGSFYTYFKSKDEVILDHYMQIDDAYEKALTEQPDGRSNEEQLLTVLQAGLLFSENLGHEFLSIVLSNQLTANNEESLIIGKERKLYPITTNIIEQGKTSGEFRFYGPTEDFVEMTLLFYRGLVFEYCLMKDPEIKLTLYAAEKIRTFIRKMLIS
ncbi:TetR/AcrR family transcriptional regulator [Halobacillus sp. Marseille-Q1614]|uniref:TetR/AcrR family transcriptional regulator n=1 Tax=Halobacillus sp. Marseille-Q1614 TaxID=2709134 RepID=UPI00156DB6DA|nr:TetR/AcrR family transcriptional regulator [Halobacillus sp. Marseille-Q1614]